MSSSIKINKVIKFLVLSLMLFSAGFASASELTVRPFLVDHVLRPRDVTTDTVVLTNDSTYRKYLVYATVNEISVDPDGEIKEFVSPVMTDRTNTITSWIEVTRGRIEVPPGERVEVPLIVRVNPFAQPGVYHAFVGFVPTSNSPKAQEIAMNGDADGVIVKVTIADDREDNMKISGFIIDRFITGEDRDIDVVIENTGDISSAPKGEVVFYDSRGIEVTAVDINTEGVEIPPGETVTLKGSVPIEDTLGRFKANISLHYGENQRAALYDTTFFYMMPLHLLLVMFGVILVGAIVVVLLFRKTFLTTQYESEDGDDVMLYVRDGHDPNPQDHDIDLKNPTKE